MYPPVTFEEESPDRIESWRPQVQWFLSIPHMLVLYALSIVAFFAWVVAWFTIVFKGRMSAEVGGWIAMVHRYQFRVSAYAGFLHQEYPPFDFTRTFEEPGGTPVTVVIEPELEDRDRLTAALRILWLIPIAFFSAIVAIAASILWFIAFFAVLFTGQWPEGLRDFVVKAMRLNLRVNTYGSLLTDKYPPFALE